MMLRSRNANTSGTVGTKPSEIPVPVKRHASLNITDSKEQPKRKKIGGLADLSNAISNSLLIDSCKKNVEKEEEHAVKSRGPANSIEEPKPKSSNDTQIHLSSNRLSVLRESDNEVEMVNAANDSIMIIEHSATEVDPCPDYDYDAENMADPFAVAAYAFDIFRYYKFREKQFTIGDYLKRQKNITKEMRAVLADWMVEMQEQLELNHETLYLAVKLTDMYLDRGDMMHKEDLQLIASTALFIASKFDERLPPFIDDFVTACEDAFRHDEMIALEQKILKTVGFDLGCPLSYRFLRRYAKVTKVNMDTLTLARFVLETSLMFYEFVPVSESLMASAAFLMALRMKKIGDWNSVLVKYSGYKLEEVEQLMWRLNHMMWMRPKVYERLRTAYRKYDHEVFFNSTSVPLLEDRYSFAEPVGPPVELSFAARPAH